MNNSLYVPPQVEVLQLESHDCILELSNFGTPGAPGTGFGNGDIIDGGLIF